jgi:hypothetical protein
MFWEQGFWESGFWAEGFWEGMGAGNGVMRGRVMFGLVMRGGVMVSQGVDLPPQIFRGNP